MAEEVSDVSMDEAADTSNEATDEVRSALYSELADVERMQRGVRALHQTLLQRRGDLLISLRDIGESSANIAARLGVTRGTIDKSLRLYRKR